MKTEEIVAVTSEAEDGPHPMTRQEAEARTEQYRQADQAQWARLLALYEGGAHTALGYERWGDYAWDELDLRSSDSYRILDAARVERALAVIPQMGNGLRASHARELAPLLKSNEEGFDKVVYTLLESGATWHDITAGEVARVADRVWNVPQYVKERAAGREKRSAEKRLGNALDAISRVTRVLTPQEIRHLPKDHAAKLLDELEALSSALRERVADREPGKMAA